MKRLLLYSFIIMSLFSCDEENVPLHLGDVISRDNTSWELASFTVDEIDFIDSLDTCVVNAEVQFNENNRFFMTSNDPNCELSEQMTEGFWNVDINSQFFSWFNVTNNQVGDFIINDVQATNFTISSTDTSGQESIFIYRLK